MALPRDFIKIILLLQLKLVSLQVPDPKPSHILQEDHQDQQSHLKQKILYILSCQELERHVSSLHKTVVALRLGTLQKR